MRQPAAFRPSRYFSTVDETSKPVNAAVVLFASWPYRFPLAVASASRGNRPRGRRCRSPSFPRQSCRSRLPRARRQLSTTGPSRRRCAAAARSRRSARRRDDRRRKSAGTALAVVAEAGTPMASKTLAGGELASSLPLSSTSRKFCVPSCDLACHDRSLQSSREADMQRVGSSISLTGESGPGWGTRRGLRLAGADGARTGPSGARGPDKYRLLDLKRRRAQIRARRELRLG